MTKRAEFFIRGRDSLAKPYHYQASGLDNIFLLNGVSETNTPHGPMIHIEDIHGLNLAIGLHIAEKPEPMTGAEFRFLRKQLGLSQLQLAARAGVTDQTIANYEKGKVNALGSADPFLRAIYLVHILPAQTRIRVLKLMMEKVRQKLPEVPRRSIVGAWREQQQEAV
jgi:transcriptional regulator with XRE-family HTH domain